MATRDEWAGHVKQWEASGLDAAAYAAREGIIAKRLVWWRWKLRSTPATSAPESRFLPVRIVDSAARPEPAAASIEIALPNGRVVRVAPGFDPAALEQVLAIADRGDAC
jgi:transposase